MEQDQVKQSAASDMMAQVAKLVSESTESVKSRVVSALVEKEVSSRVDMVMKALDSLQSMKKELAKIKPDVETFDAAGNKLSHFSKAKFEEKKTATEKLEKLEAALTKAFEGDFSKLKELSNQK